MNTFYMKYFFLLTLIISSSTIVIAQLDSTIIYLDNLEKPCSEEKASRYAVQTKEKDHWKKIVFDMLDDKPIYGAYYIDSACVQFDGPYTSFNKDKKVISIGRYSNNKKIGIWKGFSDDGKLIDSAFYKDGFVYGTSLSWYTDGKVQDSLLFENNGKGISRGYWQDGKQRESGDYLAGKKNGQWIYYHKNGIKCQEVKYAGDSALSYTCYDDKGNLQTSNCYYEKEAIYTGGDKAWLKYLSNKLSAASLPNAYFEGKIYGTIYIQFVVDSDGKITDVKALNSIAPALDVIALGIIRQSARWEPAVQFNRNVKAYRKQPITFPKAQ